MKRLADKLLIVLPQLSLYDTRADYLSKAYVNLVRFFRKRFGIESHVISSAECCLVVPELEGVKAVQAIHPADVEFFNRNVMLLEDQDVIYEDAFNVAAAKVPLMRGLSIDQRLAHTAAREKAAVWHIALNHYNFIVDFEHPRNSMYHLSPNVTRIYLRVSTTSLIIEAFMKGKPFDLGSLLKYDGANRPLGAWDEGGNHCAVS